IIFSKNENKLEQWMQQASEIKTIPELESYIEGLKQDISAVKNAILYDHNNGLAEAVLQK
ncbi:MAG: ISL3 family transposase, partial [Ruminococcus sp.]|nr:ISL3 family transposase [Ruminococcus sp.]